MKKILFLSILVPIINFSQYPSWLPTEFRNKIFCGKKGSESYKLIISEEGFQLVYKSRTDNYKSVKLNYKTKNVSQNTLWKQWSLDLSTSNETNDSPYDPTIKLKKVIFETPTDYYLDLIKRKNNLTRDEHRQYFKTIEWAEKRGSDKPHFYFDANILQKYIDIEVNENLYKRDICSYLKDKKTKELERKKDIEILKNITSLLETNNPKNAAKLYSKLNYPTKETKNRIYKALKSFVKQNGINLELDSIAMLKLIKSKKDLFMTLNTGMHELKLGADGMIFIDGKETNQKTNPTYLNFGVNNEFKIPVPGKKNFKHSVKETLTGIICDVNNDPMRKNSFYTYAGGGRYTMYKAGKFYLVLDKKGREKCLFTFNTNNSQLNRKKYPTLIKEFDSYSLSNKKFRDSPYENVKIIYTKISYVNNIELTREFKDKKVLSFKYF